MSQGRVLILLSAFVLGTVGLALHVSRGSPSRSAPAEVPLDRPAPAGIPADPPASSPPPPRETAPPEPAAEARTEPPAPASLTLDELLEAAYHPARVSLERRLSLLEEITVRATDPAVAAKAWYTIGMRIWKLQPPRSFRAFEDAVRLSAPDTEMGARARYQAAFMGEKLGDKIGAEPVLLEAVRSGKLPPDWHLYAQLYHAWWLVDLGRPGRARDELRAFLAEHGKKDGSVTRKLSKRARKLLEQLGE